MVFLKPSFAILSSLVTMAIANHDHRVAFERSTGSMRTPSFSTAEVNLCPQLPNCVLENGKPVYSFSNNTELSVAVKNSNSPLPSNPQQGDQFAILFPSNVVQDTGNLNYQSMVSVALKKASKRAGLEEVDSADLPAGGEAVVVDPGRNQTVINQCRVQATRDWRSDIPGTQATLFQTITNGVEGMTNASTAPGPGGNPCNSFGDCQTIEDGAPVRRTFAPASMSVILLNYTGSDWSALGRMAYSLHCLKSTPWDCSSASEEIDEIQGMMPVEQREAAGDIQVLCGN